MGDWLTIEYYGNSIQDWGISLLIILGGIIIGKILFWLFSNVVKKITKKTKTNLDDLLVDMLEEPLVFGFILSCIWYAIARLTFTPGIDQFFSQMFNILIAINVTWLLTRTIDALIEEYVVPLTQKSDSDLDNQLLPILRKGIRSILWILGIIVGLQNAGFNVTALIAGLGVGGLALALAAQDSVKNIFGGLMIFLDKPFKIKDRIKIEGYDGTIVEIGIRSTRLQTLEGRIVTIPNAHFAEGIIENVSREPSRKVVLNLGMTYDTSPDQLKQAMVLLKEIAKNQKDKIESDPIIGFNNFGDFSLGLIFIYYIRKESDILGTQTEINMEVLEKFNENSLDFAFPTQTIIAENKNQLN